jgi:hypothetical protein
MRQRVAHSSLWLHAAELAVRDADGVGGANAHHDEHCAGDGRLEPVSRYVACKSRGLHHSFCPVSVPKSRLDARKPGAQRRSQEEKQAGVKGAKV